MKREPRICKFWRFCYWHRLLLLCERKTKKNLLRMFMNFNNNKVRKVIYHISTRCLILGKCSERTLIQRYYLKSYFMSNFNLDDDPTEHDPDEKPSREKRLVNAFKEPVRKLYAMFLHSAIPIFDSFNTFLQAEETLIHVLYCIILLCVGIAHYFQHLSYLKLSKNQMMY